MTTTTSRALPRVHAGEARGHKDALLALAGAHPVEWTDEHPEAHLTAVTSSSPRIGDWLPENTVLDDPTLMLLHTQEEIIDGVPHLKVVRRPVIAASAFADDEDALVEEDEDPFAFTRLAAQRQAREDRIAKRKKILRYSSLGALLMAVAGLVFYLSPVGQDLLTNTETVTVEIEKEKTYTGELLD